MIHNQDDNNTGNCKYNLKVAFPLISVLTDENYPLLPSERRGRIGVNNSIIKSISCESGRVHGNGNSQSPSHIQLGERDSSNLNSCSCDVCDNSSCSTITGVVLAVMDEALTAIIITVETR